MIPVVAWTAVSLAAAAGVLVLCSRPAGDDLPGRSREFLDDLAAGLRRRDGASRLRDEVKELSDGDGGSVGQLFEVGRPGAHGYVDAEELAQTFGRAGRAPVRRDG